MPYDLHIHSIYSDGTMAPAELVRKAQSIGLDGISLTDHDTIAGQAEAIATAKELAFCFIPGVEFTTDYETFEVHILGYDFDLQSVKLERKFQAILEYRIGRAREIVRRLREANVPLEWEEVTARTTSRFIGRAHIFRELERVLQVSPEKRRTVFDHYLGTNGVAYVPHGEIGAFEAVELIQKAGGVAVLAHPGRMVKDEFIQRLAAAGLQGIEAYYPMHTPEMVRHYRRVAKKFNLFLTGGSDYHGDNRHIRMGDAAAPEVKWYFERRTFEN